jgi:hypothetical protein
VGDCISSIRIAPGWQATIYQDDGFKGHSVETTDLANLQLVAGSCDHDGHERLHFIDSCEAAVTQPAER